MQDMEKPVYICKNCTGINYFHRHVCNNNQTISMLHTLFYKPELNLKEMLGDEWPKFVALSKQHALFSGLEEFYESILLQFNNYERKYPQYKSLFDKIAQVST